MTLEDAIAAFEARFRFVVREPGRDGDFSRAPNGARYATVSNAGVKLEGQPFARSEDDEAAAVKGWLASALAYAEGRSGCLYWRTLPQVEREGRRRGRTHDRFVVYSRLAVSRQRPRAVRV